jgi:8-oxo-dGTP pyrophosphatase MutT (NUDIX family)
MNDIMPINQIPADHHDEPPSIPAATLVVFRRDPAGGPAQLLLVERSGTMRFAGGATVFPGGRVDPSDHGLAASYHGGLVLDEAAARIAAVRETLEETGLVIGIEGAIASEAAGRARQMLADQGDLAPVLDAFGWRLALDRLVPFARWCPQHPDPVKNFDTRFYLADLGTGAVDVEVDATENRHLFWASARDALGLADQGNIRIIFPTRRNLERLAQFDGFDQCRSHALEIPIGPIHPRWVVHDDGSRWLTIPGGFGYPVLAEPDTSAARG